MLTCNIDGQEYPLATTLRVAYEVQGQHNHKPYAEVFKDIGNMGVEQQIDILFAAFKCANGDMVKNKEMTQTKFREYYLDNCNLKDLMDQLQAIVKGIMGEDEDSETGDEETTAGGNGDAEEEGN